jgi:hypothetical protein
MRYVPSKLGMIRESSRPFESLSGDRYQMVWNEQWYGSPVEFGFREQFTVLGDS